MREGEAEGFAKFLRGLAELHDKTLSSAALDVWWSMLEPYTLDDVMRALYRHERESSFMPRPHDVIARIEGDDGRPGAEVAWSIALRAHDERESVIWTADIADAFGVAKALLEAGDEVGGRMAFKERYERRVGQARERGEPVHFQLSLGLDPHRRADVIVEAFQAGRISREHAVLLLPSADLVGGAARALLESPGAAEEEPAVAPSAALARMRAAVTASVQVPSLRIDEGDPEIQASRRYAAGLRERAEAQVAAEAELGGGLGEQTEE